jgi:hypothetical protein
MLRFVLILLAIWVAIAIIGFVVHALLWLAVVAIIAFLITAAFGGINRGRMGR